MATASVTVTAGATEGSYSASFASKLSSGTALLATTVGVDVAKPGLARLEHRADRVQR